VGKLGYPDLQDESFVFEALLGYGMFSAKLPPCFTSTGLLEFKKWTDLPKKPVNHAYIEYRSTKHTCVPRQFSVPHPVPYYQLCSFLKENWTAINEFIGDLDIKFNFCHVRKIKDKNYIFEMNYTGGDKWIKEENEIDYALNCKYVAIADISTFFPSIYTHAIPWAVKGKEAAKKHQCCSWKKKVKGGKGCKNNDDNPCAHTSSDLWHNDLDAFSRAVKDFETNGVLIGPHASNVIAELILTRVDQALQKAGYKKVVRHIDDYKFYAESEEEALGFLKKLSLELKAYELSLNSRKTKIVTYHQYLSDSWLSKIHQFTFPPKEPIGFTSVNSFVDFAIKLSSENEDYSALNYAIKVVADMKLSARARRMYVKKICQISLDMPYVVPLLGEHVLGLYDDKKFLKIYIDSLIKRSLLVGSTDSLGYAFFFAIKYDIKLDFDKFDSVISMNDCVSMLLAYEYCKFFGLSITPFKDKCKAIMSFSEREQDKYWLLLYEVMPKSSLKGWLKKIKEEDISFVDFSSC